MEKTDTITKDELGKKPVWQRIALIVLLSIVALGAAYYLKSSRTGPNGSGQAYSPTNLAVIPSPTLVNVTGSDFAFTPSNLTLKSGETVSLNFKNDGQVPHNFSIPDLKVQTKTLQPGEEDVIQFTPTQPGTYTFLCTVPGHADKGMTGALIVQ